MEKQPRVLILSRDSWNDTNNSGNTLSNLFQNWKTENVANLYCRDEIPNNNICSNYFKISENILIKKIFKKIDFAGQQHGKINVLEVKSNLKEFVQQEKERKLYDFFRKKRWYIFLWVREILWKVAPWKSKELQKFITDFNPQIIYSPSYDSIYMHSLLYFLKLHTNAKIVYFHCDDLVTYRQHSFSPFFWINRYVLRKYMNKSINVADKNYCIIDEQARVYGRIYNKSFDLLYKTGDFESKLNSTYPQAIVKLVYTGNIIYGRIETLIAIAEVLSKINKKTKRAELYLYTANPIESKCRNKLLATNSVRIMDKVPYKEIPLILNDASILIHVESFEKQQKLATSLSFSTKLVDYFEAGKPIFAVGWEKAASVVYLQKNNLASVANNLDDIHTVLLSLIENNSSFQTIGNIIWDFGKKHHSKSVVLYKFEEELKKMIV
jgi:hypothetical protein